MAIDTNENLARPEELTLEEISARGAARYEELREQIEATDWNRFVAIDVVSGDYAIGRTSGDAMRGMDARNPEARLFLRKIGNEPEPGLAMRAFGIGFLPARRDP